MSRKQFNSKKTQQLNELSSDTTLKIIMTDIIPARLNNSKGIFRRHAANASIMLCG